MKTEINGVFRYRQVSKLKTSPRKTVVEFHNKQYTQSLEYIR